MNNLLKNNNTLMKEYDYKKNKDINLDRLTLGSNKKIWWLCNKKHEYQQVIYKRANNHEGCPYCSNKKVLKGYNDLATVNPRIAKEWNYEKNGELTPDKVIAGSSMKVWWVCEKGHEWEAVIWSRNKGRTCPYCSNRKVLKGYNDLATVNPRIAKEWNYEKNGKLKPENIIAGSQKAVWWKCERGHEWKTMISERNKGNNCPICGNERKTSVSEKSFLFYIKRYCNDEIIPNYRSKLIENKELDIFIKNLKIGIEYDGRYYHKNKSRDKLKDIICNKHGIKVYHILEDKENNIRDNYILYNINSHPKDNLEWAINKMLNILFGNKKYDINLERDQIEIYNIIEFYEKENSLFNRYPELAQEWHPTKNGKLTPAQISYGSLKKVWWQGKCGHEWVSDIYSRVAGAGCPYCSNNKVLSGFNDLLTINPALVKEWNYEKNKDINPNNISPKSNKKVWWICEKGHEWEARIYNRATGQKCPICSGRKALLGYNDLSTTNPELLEYWDFEKNGDLNPKQFTNGSNKKIYWKCPLCNKQWTCRIVDMIKRKNICKNCKK